MGLKILAQRKLVLAPGGVAQPFAAVGSGCGEAEEIERRPLHAARAVKNRRQVRIVRAGKRQRENHQAVASRKRDVDGISASVLAVVASPQRNEAPALLRHTAGSLA